jgi:hypothetical protein
MSRETSKSYLINLPDQAKGYESLTPTEAPIVATLGTTLAKIIQHTLRKWAKAMVESTSQDPPLRPIKERTQVDLIMKHLRAFQSAYERVFGLMEEVRGSALGEIVDHNTVIIRSTGYGSKVLLGLLMADRLHVVDRIRKFERERIGFRDLELSDLQEDAKHCPICQENFGEGKAGTEEKPIQLVVCCGQVFGDSCLRRWLAQHWYDNAPETCPTCRYRFSKELLDKFLGDQYLYEELDIMELDEPANGQAHPHDHGRVVAADGHQTINLVSPTPPPEPRAVINLDPEQDSQVPLRIQRPIVRLITTPPVQFIDLDDDNFEVEG